MSAILIVDDDTDLRSALISQIEPYREFDIIEAESAYCQFDLVRAVDEVEGPWVTALRQPAIAAIAVPPHAKPGSGPGQTGSTAIPSCAAQPEIRGPTIGPVPDDR